MMMKRISYYADDDDVSNEQIEKYVAEKQQRSSKSAECRVMM